MPRDTALTDVYFVGFDAGSARKYYRCVSYLIAAVGFVGFSFTYSPLVPDSATFLTELTVERDGIQFEHISSPPSLVVLLALGSLTTVLLVSLALIPRLLHKQFDSQKCRVTRTRVEYESGWITRSMQTIPLDRIQDVTVKQGLLQQYFGIRNIEIQTAGSGGPLPEVSLVGPKNALAVRDAIMSYRDALVFGGHRGSSIPTASDPGLATRQSLKPSASEGRDIDLVEVLSELTESMRRIEALITEAIQKVN